MRRLIKIYDTTLRDGTQGEGVSFSMEDKVRLATRLDALGIHYIEGGWPGSNPKDLRFFRRMQDVALKHAKLAAFSMTRRAGGNVDSDANMQALLESGAPVATIVGKSWDFHVTEALGTTLAENLAMIGDTLAFLRSRMDEVLFDAEHFFDGFRARCGNANLVSIIPSLILKMGLDCIPEPNLRELRDVSRFVSELANRTPWSAQPYVGDSAFAHKGGMHVSAVLKHPETYEHI